MTTREPSEPRVTSYKIDNIDFERLSGEAYLEELATELYERQFEDTKDQNVRDQLGYLYQDALGIVFTNNLHLWVGTRVIDPEDPLSEPNNIDNEEFSNWPAVVELKKIRQEQPDYFNAIEALRAEASELQNAIIQGFINDEEPSRERVIQYYVLLWKQNLAMTDIVKKLQDLGISRVDIEELYR